MVASSRITHDAVFRCFIDDSINLCLWTTQAVVAVGGIKIGLRIVADASIDSAPFIKYNSGTMLGRSSEEDQPSDEDGNNEETVADAGIEVSLQHAASIGQHQSGLDTLYDEEQAELRSHVRYSHHDQQSDLPSTGPTTSHHG